MHIDKAPNFHQLFKNWVPTCIGDL